jgi:hypothetical protein
MTALQKAAIAGRTCELLPARRALEWWYAATDGSSSQIDGVLALQEGAAAGDFGLCGLTVGS